MDEVHITAKILVTSDKEGTELLDFIDSDMPIEVEVVSLLPAALPGNASPDPRPDHPPLLDDED